MKKVCMGSHLYKTGKKTVKYGFETLLWPLGTPGHVQAEVEGFQWFVCMTNLANRSLLLPAPRHLLWKGPSILFPPGVPLIGLNQNENVVHTNSQHQEGDYLKDDERGRDSREAKCS